MPTNRFIQLCLMYWGLGVAFLLFSGVGAVAAESVKFTVASDMRAVYAKARKQNKHVLVYVMADYCKWCKLMDNSIYPNPMVAALINETCLAIRADTGTKPGMAISALFPGTGVPRQYLMTAAGEKLDSIGAWQTPGQELLWLMKHLKPNATVLAKLEKKIPAPAALAKAKLPELQTAAMVYYFNGKREQALKLYGPEVVGKLTSAEEREAYVDLWAHQLKDNFYGAALAQQAITKAKNTVENQLDMGWLFYKADSIESALDCVEQAQKLEPNNEKIASKIKFFRYLLDHEDDNPRKKDEELDALPLPAPAAQPVVNFIVPESMDAAYAQAQKENKLVYLYITSPGCGWCKYMEKVIFTQPLVAWLINSTCLLVKADISTPEGKKLASGFKAAGTPNRFLLNANGQVLANENGASQKVGSEIAWLVRGVKPTKEILDKLEAALPGADRFATAGTSSLQALSAIYLVRGEQEKALKAFGPQTAARLRSPEQKNNYAWYWAYQVGDNLQSALEVQQAAVKEKRSAQYLDTLGYCYYALKDYANAVATQEEAVKMNPGNRGYQENLTLFRKALEAGANKVDTGGAKKAG